MTQLTETIWADEVPDIMGFYSITGKWELVTDDSRAITEEQAREAVANFMEKSYFDYMNPDKGGWAPGYIFDTALESFRSLLISKGLNPSTRYLIIKKKEI